VIDGLRITPLRQIGDERGKVMHMLRSDSEVFTAFGEIYFSTVHPGVVKAWHLHKRMILNYAVPVGRIRFVLYDDRAESPTRGELQEIVMGPDDYVLVTVPPLVWNGFKGLGRETSMVANCTSIPHDPDEIERRDPRDPTIPYDWDIRHG
jgi:dTDP-4-dehydrorhamnose 3,5-epimerase